MKLYGAIRHPAEPRVLLLRSDRTWGLPRVVAPRIWIAEAGAVADAFERRLGMRPWLLRQLRFSEDDAVLELELTESAWETPRHGRWVDRDGLDRVRLRDEDDRALLAAYLDELAGDEVPAERAPWAQPGWRERAEAWLVAEAARAGRRVHAIEQVKHWSISAVLRARTDGPDLYLKVPARLPLFVEEAAVTAELARRFPGHVPAPLAVEPDEGWLLLPAFDELPGWSAPVELRHELFRRFAALQRRAESQVDALLAAGCIDRRLDVLAGQLDALVTDPRPLRRLTRAERAALKRVTPVFHEVCGRLAELGPAPTLVHGDLHLGNVARLNGELVYFDWTDACVAHPFVDLLSLRWERDETVRAALLETYLEAWDDVPPERLREAVALAQVAIPLHHAVSYQRIVWALEPTASNELDASHEFLREAIAAARAL